MYLSERQTKSSGPWYVASPIFVDWTIFFSVGGGGGCWGGEKVVRHCSCGNCTKNRTDNNKPATNN